MLEPVRHILDAKRIILASGSPRRSEILRSARLKFRVVPSTAEENLDRTKFGHAPWDFAIQTARLKADEVFERVKQESDVVIGADTVISKDGRIFGKPEDRAKAFEMLRLFSGASHTVYTGVVMIGKRGEVKEFFEATEVTFDELTDEVINGYIDTGEPMDKAGAYGIQAEGGSLVKEIKGDYYNVVGFPLNRFCREICSMVGSTEAAGDD